MKGAFIEWVNIDLVRPNPENPNRHNKVQVERLAKLIKAYGWRHPLILDIKNNQIVVGHCRYEAAKLMGLTEVPVHFQEFASDDEAYGFMVADNGISDFSELDFSEINKKLQDLGPDFDLELLGLHDDFQLEPADKDLGKFQKDLNLEQWIIAVECKSETDMRMLYEEFHGRGLTCKLIT